MRNLLLFIINNGTLVYFFVLELFCALLIVNFNDYQRSAFLSSSNAVCGTVYSMQTAVSKYFNLTDENDILVQELQDANNKIERLQAQLNSLPDSLLNKNRAEITKNYRSAKVINISTNKQYNYLTLNKGENDGITKEMTVTSCGNVVGIIVATSSHFSTVLPIINTNFRLSVKLSNSNFRGQLVWNNHSASEATVIDIPEHATVAVGDSVVTSGASSYFPEGIPVGIVKTVDMDRNGGFYRLTIALATDFYSIYNVQITENMQREEQLELEALQDE